MENEAHKLNDLELEGEDIEDMWPSMLIYGGVLDTLSAFQQHADNMLNDPEYRFPTSIFVKGPSDRMIATLRHYWGAEKMDDGGDGLPERWRLPPAIDGLDAIDAHAQAHINSEMADWLQVAFGEEDGEFTVGLTVPEGCASSPPRV